MPPEDKTFKFDIGLEEAGERVDDPGTETVVVPEGELWYVESLSSDCANPSSVGIGVFDTTPVDSDSINQTGGRQTYNNSPSSTPLENLGAYASGGETIIAGIHMAGGGTATAICRRVL